MSIPNLRRRRGAGAPVLAVTLLSLCCNAQSPEGEAGGGCGPTAAAVSSVAEGIIEADNAHDLERVLAHYTEDITFMTPDGELVEGKDQVRPRYQELFEHFSLDFRMESDEVGVGDGWAFVRGRTLGTLTPREGGEVQQLNDRFMMILRCEPAQGWLIARLMWVRAGSILDPNAG